MTAICSTSNHARRANTPLIISVLIGIVAALAAVGCEGAATDGNDIVKESGAQSAAAADAAAKGLSVVASDQLAFFGEASVQPANIDPAMLQPERRSEFPELAPLSAAEMTDLMRGTPVQPATIDPAMLQPERQTEFPELAPVLPAEMTATLREVPVQPATIDPAMLQPERQTEFPELAPLSSAEMAAVLP